MIILAEQITLESRFTSHRIVPCHMEWCAKPWQHTCLTCTVSGIYISNTASQKMSRCRKCSNIISYSARVDKPSDTYKMSVATRSDASVKSIPTHEMHCFWLASVVWTKSKLLRHLAWNIGGSLKNAHLAPCAFAAEAQEAKLCQHV